MYDNISPKYIIELVPKIEDALWSMFDTQKYTRVKHYILRWHEENDSYNYNDYWQNFEVHYKKEADGKDGVIDLTETLYGIPPDILIRIAIDLGVDTPGFLPSVPQFKNVLKNENENAYQSFDRAIKNTLENPDEAISLANSTLEGIIKNILSDESFADVNYNHKATLYDLTNVILKQYKLFPGNHQELKEVNVIGSSLLAASQNIEALRSEKTNSHGKAKEDYVIEDPL